ncbi:MAG: hypothetical protein LLG20_17425 [Acidobacteriales bacterium]|nr:hypothetical protein [Terriglobales bacterium]
MTGRATRRHGIFAFDRLTVEALVMLCLLVRVAGSTNDPGKFFRMRQGLAFQISVAIGAGQLGMRRGAQRGRIKSWWYAGFPLSRPPAGVVATSAFLGSW